MVGRTLSPDSHDYNYRSEGSCPRSYNNSAAPRSSVSLPSNPLVKTSLCTLTARCAYELTGFLDLQCGSY